jgi:hypothetical protein
VIIHLDLLAVRIGQRAQKIFARIFRTNFRRPNQKIRRNKSILSESSGEPAGFKRICVGAAFLSTHAELSCVKKLGRETYRTPYPAVSLHSMALERSIYMRSRRNGNVSFTPSKADIQRRGGEVRQVPIVLKNSPVEADGIR